MKLSFSAPLFFKQLQQISGVISGNPAMPILENFLFILKGNVLSVWASDTDTYMSTKIEVSGEEDGSIAMPAKLFLDTIKNFPDVPVTLTVNPESLLIQITGPASDFKLTGENVENYPQLAQIEDGYTTSLRASLLGDVISKTLFAVSTDDMRPAMGGVNFEIAQDGANFVATDAHKLVKFCTGNGVSTESAQTFIIPRKALSLLKSVLGPEIDSRVEIKYNDNNASFHCKDVVLFCRLINAKYPDYNSVIPKNNDITLQIDRASFASALRRVNLFANKSTNQVQLFLDKNELIINAQDLDYSNEGRETLACKFDGEPMKIAFNGRFLLEVVAILDEAKELEIRFSSPSRAVLLYPGEQEEGQEITLLIMPIMVNN